MCFVSAGSLLHIPRGQACEITENRGERQEKMGVF